MPSSFPHCLSTFALLWTKIPDLGRTCPIRHGAPSWSSPCSAVSGRENRRDDDEDQHSAVLWLSNRKVEVKEPEQRERKDEKHSLRERPRDRRCGRGPETASTPTRSRTAGEAPRPRPLPRDEEPLQQRTETGPRATCKGPDHLLYKLTLFSLVSNCIPYSKYSSV